MPRLDLFEVRVVVTIPYLHEATIFVMCLVLFCSSSVENVRG